MSRFRLRGLGCAVISSHKVSHWTLTGHFQYVFRGKDVNGSFEMR